MKSHRISLTDGEFSNGFKEKERIRAMERLKTADSFVVITKIGTDNDCISAIEGDHTTSMAFNCHLAEQGLIKTIKENEEID